MKKPELVLQELGEGLKKSEGFDQDLVSILAERLLTTSPSANCVQEALSAIEALAEARAQPDEEPADE